MGGRKPMIKLDSNFNNMSFRSKLNTMNAVFERNHQIDQQNLQEGKNSKVKKDQKVVRNKNKSFDFFSSRSKKKVVAQ